MTDKLSIIDQETRAELAELGMEVAAPVHSCGDCRFQYRSYGSAPAQCIAQGNAYISASGFNLNADCRLWQPDDASRRRQHKETRLARRDRSASVSVLQVASFFMSLTSMLGVLWILLAGAT